MSGNKEVSKIVETIWNGSPVKSPGTNNIIKTARNLYPEVKVRVVRYKRSMR